MCLYISAAYTEHMAELTNLKKYRNIRWLHRPGGCIRVFWNEFGFTGFICRIKELGLGNRD